jgi:hypothetical protein
MRKNSVIEVSITVLCFIILSLFTNVVGYQMVQSSNKETMSNEVDPKELLFQTILDIANNKDIKKIILHSEMRQSVFFNPGLRFTIFTQNVLTKKELNSAYHIGLVFSRNLDASTMHLILERYQVNHQEKQKEITKIIEKDVTLNRDIAQLSNSNCDCENDDKTSWSFPILCLLLVPFAILGWILYFLGGISFIGEIVWAIGSTLNCPWSG